MRHKYGRTLHFPFSPGRGSDDKVMHNLDHFDGQAVVATIKMDGENTTLYSDGYTHARSIDSKGHASRNWVKMFWAQRSFLLPAGWRICGENMFAKHSIHYKNLESYFYGFSVWDEKNRCLSWDDTLMVFEEVGIQPVPVIWQGIFEYGFFEQLGKQILQTEDEGFVVRTIAGFDYPHEDHCFKNLVKFVRPGHVQTDDHWAHQEIIPNILKPDL